MSTVVPLASLPQEKRAQLISSVNSPPVFFSIESYRFDSAKRAYVYLIQVGVQQGGFAIVHHVERRFSDLYAFDRQIRPCYGGITKLVEFPPKKLIGNRNPEFLEQRAEQLREYLSCLGRLPDIPRNGEFIEMSDVKRTVYTDL